MTSSRSTKRALLTSALAILMCVAMLIGSTFAWFTDTASTAVNKIQAGNLDVKLMMLKGSSWVSAEGETLTFKTKDGRAADKILWEPGCTYELPALRIDNRGNLALKYKIIISGIQGDAELNEAIEWKIADGLVMGGIFHEMGVAAMEGVLYPSPMSPGYPNATNAFVISGHMKEDAGNKYQGLSIEGIGITVVATQATDENDSFGNQYDKDATYPSVEPTVYDGETATIDFNSKADGGWGVIQAKNGAKLTIKGDAVAIESEDRYAMAVYAVGNETRVTIEGGLFTQEITGTDNQYDLIYAAGGAQIEITGGTFKIGGGDPKWTLNCKDNSGSKITVKGGTFYKFDPSAERTGQAEEVVVPTGYKVVQNGDWYTVVANN